MHTKLAQRWSKQRGVYVPAGVPIVTREYEITSIPDDRTAKAFVCEHHYSGSFPAARKRFGLYHGAELVGVAVFSVPAQPKVLDRLPGDRNSGVELGRLVLLDSVPANGESWFVARCFDELRRGGYTGVVSFSDPVEHRTTTGAVVFAGHIGTVYQALNATYVGRAKPRSIRLLPDGSVLSDRALSKIRVRDQGWRYSARLLERHGAEPLGEHEDSRAWLARWLPVLTQRVRHGGNHVYLWALDKRLRRRLPACQPYPKFDSAKAV